MCSILATMSRSIERQKLKESMKKAHMRGPDMERILEVPIGKMCFQRLSIMGLTEAGMQPFTLHDNVVICNGEIYGFQKYKEELEELGYKFQSQSDCEILLPMYEQYGLEMFRRLGSEFALVIYDSDKNTYIAARDPIGIRPMFYGYDANGDIYFASEARMLIDLVESVKPFPPGHYYMDGDFVSYINLTDVKDYVTGNVEIACKNIHDLLLKSVETRMCADAPLGFLLSGGLDSSLVCGMAARILKKSGRKIRTFAIGMEADAIDLKYARKVADYIGSEHREFYMTPEDVIEALPEVIKILGTWDITTIRASIGMYLCCKAIHENTDVRVLMTGEISDELFGYKYTDFAPSPEEFQKESKKRIDELYMYDVLRADRCVADNSLEARVPFGDTDFVKYVMSINPEIKMNKYDCGKYLLRHAFEEDHLIPDEILWREKAAFSDAVGHSMVDDLKEYAEKKYSDEEFKSRCKKYIHCPPFTKESLLYREIFESFYPGQDEMIKDYWMPNKHWENCDVDDPSARVLKNYGKSGM